MLNLMKTAAVAAVAATVATAGFAEVNLTSNAAGAGTAGALTATSLVEFAAERGIANIQLKDGQTGTKFTMDLAEGKIDLASGPFILPFLLGRAAGPFSNLDKETAAELGANVQILYPYTFSIFTLYSYNNKGVDSWDDIEGMKVLNGPPQGTAALNSRSLIQLYTGMKSDEDYESVTVSWGQMAQAVIDGTVDAAVVPVMFPGPRVTQAAAAGAMTMVSMPREAFEAENVQKFLNKPGSSPYVVPLADIQAAMGDEWTVISEDDMFRGLAIPGGDLVNKNVDEEVAYQLTKAHIENLDRIKSMAPFMASMKHGLTSVEASGMCGVNPVKYHPGAVRAWEEAGHVIPECAKP